jgi:hypothetical protein
MNVFILGAVTVGLVSLVATRFMQQSSRQDQPYYAAVDMVEENLENKTIDEDEKLMLMQWIEWNHERNQRPDSLIEKWFAEVRQPLMQHLSVDSFGHFKTEEDDSWFAYMNQFVRAYQAGDDLGTIDQMFIST